MKFHTILKVDEINQRISLDVDQIYSWRDDRVHIDQNHTFWENQADALNLHGEFVDRCLWTPGLQFKGLNKVEIVRLTPSSSNGSPVKVLLGVNGSIQVVSTNVHITVSCYMDFDGYPFDQQVNTIKLLVLAVR